MKKTATNHRFKKLLKATGPIPGNTFEHGDTCLTNDKAYLSLFNLFTLVSHYIKINGFSLTQSINGMTK